MRVDNPNPKSVLREPHTSLCAGQPNWRKSLFDMTGSWRFWGVLYLVVLAWALWPIGSLLIANGVAAVLQCDLSRGGPSPCSLLGVDIGHQLYSWATVFW